MRDPRSTMRDPRNAPGRRRPLVAELALADEAAAQLDDHELPVPRPLRAAQVNSRSCQKATSIRIRLTYAKPAWMLDGNIRESAEPAFHAARRRNLALVKEASIRQGNAQACQLDHVM
jgi:hypothetical protein